MPRRSPPRLVDIPSIRTTAAYYREGRRHLALAVANHPNLDLLDALVRDAGSGPVLRPRTVRRYRCEYQRVTRVIARRHALPSTDIELALEKIDLALGNRRGTPTIGRSSTKMVRDIAEDEAEKVFSALKAQALRKRSILAAAAALFCMVAARLGPRPLELAGSYMIGNTLFLRMEKRTSGHPEFRPLDLANLHPSLIEATRFLIAVMPGHDHHASAVRWRNSLAETLARACTIRRLALYSFRHVAIATWERSGFSAAEIAQLAGHLGLKTASIHYARGNVGWAAESGLPRVPAPERTETVSTPEVSTPQEDVAASDPFVFDEGWKPRENQKRDSLKVGNGNFQDFKERIKNSMSDIMSDRKTIGPVKMEHDQEQQQILKK